MKAQDGSMNLMEWEVGIPGKANVRVLFHYRVLTHEPHRCQKHTRAHSNYYRRPGKVAFSNS